MDAEEFLEIMIIFLILGGVFFVAMVVAGIYKGKTVADSMKSDDANPPQKITGKVLEKITDSRQEKGGAYEFNYTIEWIVIEVQDGTRRKVRNIKPNEILIATGDIGEFTVRGETIYSFVRSSN